MARVYVNLVTLAGNVVRPGKKMFTKNKKPYVLYTVAVEKPRIQGQDRGSDFVSCVTYIKWHHPILLSEAVKGRQCLLTGHLNCWGVKEGDKWKTGYQVVTDRLAILPPLDKDPDYADTVDGGEDGSEEEGDPEEDGPPF